jgi:hypothetical protein
VDAHTGIGLDRPVRGEIEGLGFVYRERLTDSVLRAMELVWEQPVAAAAGPLCRDGVGAKGELEGRLVVG